MAKKIKDEDGKTYVEKKPFYKKPWVIVIAIIIIIAVAGSKGDETEKEISQEKSSVAETKETKVSEDDNVPTEFKSALKKADSYNKTMNMSKKGIYEQLTSEYGENFPQEAAQYAVDNLEADYNENALKKAKNYSDTMNLSKQGIYDQLVSDAGEKFAAEEAQYAIDNLETDYNRNALEKAKLYQREMSMSKEAIRQQLTSSAGEKFTAEEAEFAINNLE